MLLADYFPLAMLVAYDAGQAVMAVYAEDFAVEQKAGHSPLTKADLASHRIISGVLGICTPFPILSEESRHAPYSERAEWGPFWLVDPLDGTKEFVKRNGEFTVNIALIENGVPVFGVVYTPVTRVLHAGGPGLGAFRCADPDRDGLVEGITAEWTRLPLPGKAPADTLRVVASRSHLNPETEAFIARIGEGYAKVDLVSSGSSLKLCLVAEGSADVYPRLAPTCEWDTAAAHAVVLGAGGTVCRYEDGLPVVYNKPDLLNPHFVVAGAGLAWRAGAPR